MRQESYLAEQLQTKPCCMLLKLISKLRRADLSDFRVGGAQNRKFTTSMSKLATKFEASGEALRTSDMRLAQTGAERRLWQPGGLQKRLRRRWRDDCDRSYRLDRSIHCAGSY